MEKFSVVPKIDTVDDLFDLLKNKGYLLMPDGFTTENLIAILFGGNSEVKLVTYKKSSQDSYNEKGYFEMFKLLTQILTIVRERKGQQYQNSWCENGEYTVFDNVRRKFNRLENRYISGEEAQDGESLFDTCADMGVYNLMFCTWFMVNKSEMFENWLKNSNIFSGKESAKFFTDWYLLKQNYFNKGETQNG